MLLYCTFCETYKVTANKIIIKGEDSCLLWVLLHAQGHVNKKDKTHSKPVRVEYNSKWVNRSNVETIKQNSVREKSHVSMFTLLPSLFSITVFLLIVYFFNFQIFSTAEEKFQLISITMPMLEYLWVSV